MTDAARPGRDPGRAPAWLSADTPTLPVATFTVAGVPSALVPGRLAAGYAIGVGHSRLGADPYLSRLLGLTSEDARRRRGQGRRGNRRAVSGAVRASAGINMTGDDVRRLLSAVADVAAGDPPIPYRQDP
jgi:selenocysteine lyase/cysteine desulfurase